MHKLRHVHNPGLPVGNPLHALHDGLITPSSNIENERGGAVGSPLISFNSTFDDSFLDNLLSPSRPEERVSSPQPVEQNAVVVTPPSNQPFECERTTQDLYSWFQNSPNYEDF